MQRKLTAVIVMATALALASSATAFGAAADQGITVNLGASKAGTKKKPRSVRFVDVTTTTTPTAPNPQFATTKAIIYFDKNLVFNSRRFPSCSLVDARTAAAACKKAKVGSGSADALVGGTVPVTLQVIAFNGPKGKNLWLHVLNPDFNINTALEGTLQKVSGAYGTKLVVTIPPELQQPTAGLFATLTKFNTKVGATLRKGRVPYVALKGCTKRTLRFGGDFYFTDGDLKKVATTTRCRK